MRNQILTVLCILLLLGGCKKKKEGIEALPQATQVGKNFWLSSEWRSLPTKVFWIRITRWHLIPVFKWKVLFCFE